MPAQTYRHEPKQGRAKKQIVKVHRSSNGQFTEKGWKWSKWAEPKTKNTTTKKKTVGKTVKKTTTKTATKKSSTVKKSSETTSKKIPMTQPITKKKNSYSEYLKSVKNFQMDKFFNGGYEMQSNKYFTYRHYVNNDEVIINTGNIRKIKGNPVLIVANNKAVYLKDWQILNGHNYYNLGDNFKIVKVNRNYYKPYTFKTDFDVIINGDGSFDELITIAKSQDRQNMKVALGSMK